MLKEYLGIDHTRNGWLESQELSHDFWRNPDSTNQPEEYAKYEDRSAYILKQFRDFDIKHDAKILEIGCNCGRNLNYLEKHGYNNLTGIEINEDAIEFGKNFYKNDNYKVINSPVENIIEGLGDFDLIFTCAVLMHIHPQQADYVFSTMRKISNKIIIIEDTLVNRDYKAIFEQDGLMLIREELTKYFIPCPTKMVTQVFVK